MSATTVLGLRSSLAVTLTGLLGTYTLPNGSTTPAISVRGPQDGLAAGTTVAGLECVIMREPELLTIEQYRAPKARPVWTVYLVGWSQPAEITTAALAVIAANPGTTAERLTVGDEVGPAQQIRLEIPGAGAI